MKRYFVILIIGLIVTGLLGYPSMSLAQNKWEKKADMPTPRCALNAVVVNNMIYVMGGSDGRPIPFAGFQALGPVEVYNPLTDKWRKAPDMPARRYSFVAGVVNGKIYVLGGVTDVERRGKKIRASVKTVDIFDPVANIWKKHADAKVTRNFMGGVVVNGKFYLMGGSPNTSGNELKSTDVYDPAADAWAKGPAMIQERGDTPSASALNGKIYIFGGFLREQGVGRDPRVNDIKITEELDPAANVWTKKADMPTGRWQITPTSVAVGGKIYVIGGWGGGRSRDDVEAYDPATNTWEKKRKMPTARDNLATAAVRGKIYAIGGLGQGDKPIATVEEYTPDGWPFAVSPQGKLATTWGTIKAAD